MQIVHEISDDNNSFMIGVMYIYIYNSSHPLSWQCLELSQDLQAAQLI